MSKVILFMAVLSLALGFDSLAYAQGTIVFNNLGPNDGEVLIFNDFWSGTGVPLDRDLNFQLSVAPAGGPLTPVRRWLLSDGTANGINVAPGRFADPTHSVIVLPGIAPQSAINVEVDAWAGNYTTIEDAVKAGAGYGFGGPWTMGTGSDASPPASLEGMRQLAVRGVPEPGVLSLLAIGGLGFVALWIRRRSAQAAYTPVQSTRIAFRNRGGFRGVGERHFRDEGDRKRRVQM